MSLALSKYTLLTQAFTPETKAIKSISGSEFSTEITCCYLFHFPSIIPLVCEREQKRDNWCNKVLPFSGHRNGALKVYLMRILN